MVVIDEDLTPFIAQELVEFAGLGKVEEARKTLLEEAGGDPNICCDDGTVALICAASNEQLEVVRMLFANATLPVKTNVANVAGNTPLKAAVLSVGRNSGSPGPQHEPGGGLKMIGLLLNHGADVNYGPAPNFVSPLMYAVTFSGDKCFKAVEALLEAGASLDQVDVDGWTALMVAARQDCVAAIEALICRGADTAIKATGGKLKGWTALEIAIKHGHVDAAKIIFTAVLLRHSTVGCCCVALTTPGEEDESHQSQEEGPRPFGECSQCMSSGGGAAGEDKEVSGSGNAGGSGGVSAGQGRDCCGVGRTLTLAALDGHAGLVKTLLGAAMMGEMSLRRAMRSGCCLRAACQRGHVEVVEELLGAHLGWAEGMGGVGVNVQDTVGWSPLLGAAEYGHIEIVQYLLEIEEVDVDLADHTGHTPLMAAASQNAADMVRLLLESGARHNLKDESGSTALDLASEEGHDDIIQLLSEPNHLQEGLSESASDA